MHVHLPKPLHGWREFAGEVGIIVIGVLIALTAEQVVETLHWRNEVEAERASLLQEASDSVAGIRLRAQQQSCVDRRLDELQLVLERHHSGRPLGLIKKIPAPASVTATRGTWQIALAGQALAHMSDREKLGFSDAFGSFDIWDQAARRENETWIRFAPLNIPEMLTEQDWSGIRSAYVEAVIENDQLRVLAPWMVDAVSQNVPEIRKYRAAGDLSRFGDLTRQICQPILAGGR